MTKSAAINCLYFVSIFLTSGTMKFFLALSIIVATACAEEEPTDLGKNLINPQHYKINFNTDRIVINLIQRSV